MIFRRFLHGLPFFVRLVSSSIRVWMPSMGSKLDVPILSLHSENSLIMAATLSQRVTISSASLANIRTTTSVVISTSVILFLIAVFVSLGVCVSCRLGDTPCLMFMQCFIAITLFYCAHWQAYVAG